MKKYVASACFLVVLGIALVSGRATTAGKRNGAIAVSWQGNLATVEWKEALADPMAGAQEVPFSILTGPYLSWLSPTRATIGWEVVAEKSLSATPYAALASDYPTDKIQFRSVSLDDLKPDTEYRYRLVGQSGGAVYHSKEARFRTFPSASATTFRFAVVGDTQRGDHLAEAAEIERKLFGLIHAWNPSLLVHMGDFLSLGRIDGIKGRAAWYRAFERNRLLRGSTFLAPTLGNHCWRGGKTAWYADYFPDLLSATPAARPPFFYSLDVANVHFISLCTEVSSSAGGKDVAGERLRGLPFSYREQMQWLELDLAQCKAPWKIVYFHRPLHTVGPHPCGDDFRKDAGALFDKHQVQLVLSGHDHSYQKTKRINNVTRALSDTGSVQVVSGGGDTRIFDRVRDTPWNIVHQKINHYLQVDVTAAEIQVRAVDVRGTVFDAWRLKTTGQPEVVDRRPRP